MKEGSNPYVSIRPREHVRIAHSILITVLVCQLELEKNEVIFSTMICIRELKENSLPHKADHLADYHDCR